MVDMTMLRLPEGYESLRDFLSREVCRNECSGTGCWCQRAESAIYKAIDLGKMHMDGRVNAMWIARRIR